MDRAPAELAGDQRELDGEARLPDARLADDGDEMRLALLGRPLPDPAQRLELALPADEGENGQPPLADGECGAQGDPRGQRFCLALGEHRRRRLEDDRALCCRMRLLADENPVHRRRRLQPRSRVDDVAGDHRLAPLGMCVQRDERLAGVHGDTELQVEPLVALVHLADRVAHSERRPHRALRIVPECRRRAEDRHHRVADELLDHAAERLDLPPDAIVVRRQDRTHVLGVEPFCARGEADEIDEDDADDAALLLGTLGLAERRPAGEAEPGDVRILLPAGGTGRHGRTLRGATPGRIETHAGSPPPSAPARSAPARTGRAPSGRARRPPRSPPS